MTSAGIRDCREWSGRGVAVAVAVTLILLGLAPAASARGLDQGLPALRSDPGLTPAFEWGSRDYVVRTGGHAARLQVRLPPAWRARVDGGPWSERTFAASLDGEPGEGHTVTVRRIGSSRPGGRTFHIRALPEDFPAWSFARYRGGGPKLFGAGIRKYAIFFSGDGAPVWWLGTGFHPNNVEILDDGTIAWMHGSGTYEIHSANGDLVRTVSAVNGDTDLHDLQLLPNGNYMVGAQVYESGVDLSAYGGPPDATVMEIEIEEVDPQGNLVWSWDSADHIGLDETGRWWPHVISSPRVTGAYDVVHWNSVDVTNNALILSFRQLDAVYKIDRTSGDVLWKLGGTHTPQSLDVIGDPLGRYPLGGQHDARVIPGQALTIHDNFTDLRHRPRVVRYGIDAEAGTATLQATVSDPAVRHSGCCGSAREFGNGSWLTSWGNNKRIGAYTAGGRPIFTLAADASSYRAVPVPASTSTGDLRDSMDARFGG